MTTAISPSLSTMNAANGTNVAHDSATGLGASVPKVLLHLEGAAMCAAAATWYFYSGGSGRLFAALILVPDLALLGYLVSKRVGAVAYNTAHSLIGPFLLLGVGLLLAQPLALSIALIWITHVGVDRAVGYGLKYADGAKATHLQKI